MVAKPTVLPRWADGGSAVVVEPSAGKKDLGHSVGERPPAQFENWRGRNVYQWMQYLDTFEDEPHTYNGASTFVGNTTQPPDSNYGHGVRNPIWLPAILGTPSHWQYSTGQGFYETDGVTANGSIYLTMPTVRAGVDIQEIRMKVKSLAAHDETLTIELWRTLAGAAPNMVAGVNVLAATIGATWTNVSLDLASILGGAGYPVVTDSTMYLKLSSVAATSGVTFNVRNFYLVTSKQA